MIIRASAAISRTKLPRIYAQMIDHAIKDRPADMVVTMHSCRGNFRSTWIAEGGYEPVADVMFNETPLDGYFLEYDSDRAGGFEPLRFFPKGSKQLVLGVVTSKSGALKTRTPSSAGSTRRPNTWRSISSACRRNVALPRPRKATCSPRTSNGPSCG